MSRERRPSTVHQPETNANCTRVNVTGCGKALRIDLVDVFDSPDTRYLCDGVFLLTGRSGGYGHW